MINTILIYRTPLHIQRAQPERISKRTFISRDTEPWSNQEERLRESYCGSDKES